MKSQRVKRKRIAIVLLILLIAAFAIATFILVATFAPVRNGQAKLYPGGPHSYSNSGDYAINPKTIITNLNQGEINVFTPITVTADPFSPLPVGSFQWHQLDYFKITNALYQFVWKESSENWNLYHVYFNRGCQDNPSGFDESEITYFKTIEINGEKEYTARGIGTYPLFGEVSWGGGSNFPRPLLFGWRSIDLGKATVSADDALSIAEKNGGESARLRVKNNCRISVTLSPEGWFVEYDGYDNSTIYQIWVNLYYKGIFLKASR